MSTSSPSTSGWTAFWNRGGWWRAALVAVVYLALYLLGGQLVGLLFGDQVDPDNLFATPQSVFFGLFLPLAIGAVVLIAFVASLHWFPALFARQPIGGRWWMWLAPVAVVVAILLRLFGIDYGSYAAGVVAVTFVSGLLVGFVEEILTRGIAVKMLRDAGKSEWVVMVVSSLIFGLLHASNILGGQEILTVALTVVFAFGFGICMYLTLRVTGNLIWPMLLHGLYDPTLFLATGGIDEVHSGPQSELLTLAGPSNMIFILIAVVGLIFVRGRVKPTHEGVVA
ncbi:CPBP family intramembrane glutamic endopeptidase [Cellulomonas sp. Leaf334]|uniref:CPBP family intramembrane glutamic endopeptidase n=1 Tax=Cellulomonas sp. Leaf334 TaxID=1736339 RepID=UPI0006F7CB3A|nr:CPBP family intramembrane glutamic endopeptidase [Cellulomonas sp. Leaf334]KQR07262.1 abortive infection protein [Cellulomonas sp. Leaf334]